MGNKNGKREKVEEEEEEEGEEEEEQPIAKKLKVEPAAAADAPHQGNGPREQHGTLGNGSREQHGTKVLFRMAAVSEELAECELTCEYPPYGQAFGMEHTRAHGLHQDVFPKVEWIHVPVQTFDKLPASKATSWANKLDATMQNYITSRGLPGGAQLAAAKNGKLLYSRTFGVASMTDRSAAPPTEDALFHYGSISKSITAVAAMLLVEEGV